MLPVLRQFASSTPYIIELWYDVTVIKDATADYSEREMNAALEVNLPNYAGAIVPTDEIVKSVSS